MLAELKQCKSSHKNTIHALFSALHHRCLDTAVHSFKVARYVRVITKVLDVYSAQDFYNAALLHDIGKLGITDSILKSPKRLSQDCYEIMKTHISTGYTPLTDLNMSNLVKFAAKYHHERWDGKGYLGLTGSDIPLVARVIALADTFEALTGTRPYRKPVNVIDALNIMASTEGQFDPTLLSLFISLNSDLIKLTKGVI